MDFRQLLKLAKLKVTKPRLSVLGVLSLAHQPLEVEQIFSQAKKQLPIDRVTVYRILENLVNKGLIERVELREGKYRYEICGDHHHHLVCNTCGKIEDIEACFPKNFFTQISRSTGFKVTSHSLEFWGLCKNCG